VPALYRVFPLLPRAGAAEPGGPLHIPPQRAGRLDNPSLYAVFYASESEAGAVAEAFGRFPEWTPAILEGSPLLPGSARALARYRLEEAATLCDLDDPGRLLSLGLRPSDVVSRDYTRTREWARRIHARGEWAGVRWWSYYDPRWFSVGLWETARVALDDVRVLSLQDPALQEAARVIARRMVPG
jgi:RES domain